MDSESGTDKESVDLTIVVIGFNEEKSLGACLESCQRIRLDGVTSEIIYVDGGSTDASVSIAESFDIQVIADGETPRKAGENRNLGLHKAKGNYIQFVDGDMVMDPDWIMTAKKILDENLNVAAVFGRLEEVNQNVFYQALQIDWYHPVGEAPYCGGASLFRREPLLNIGGFPEDVAYGEEPYLCWRLRNEADQTIYHIHEVMARHDLAYAGFFDYWRRNIRVGETYAEIAQRCAKTSDPFWSKETRQQSVWGAGLVMFLVVFIFSPPLVKIGIGGFVALVVGRKIVQRIFSGTSIPVAIVYGVHTYLAKIGIAWGVFRWRVLRNN
jgi:glycosyltransferase involved in cell wall biosynthesis